MIPPPTALLHLPGDAGVAVQGQVAEQELSLIPAWKAPGVPPGALGGSRRSGGDPDRVGRDDVAEGLSSGRVSRDSCEDSDDGDESSPGGRLGPSDGDGGNTDGVAASEQDGSAYKVKADWSQPPPPRCLWKDTL
jgi:hypothetical protein